VSARVTRVPYDPAALDAALARCAARPANLDYPPSLIRRMLTTLVTGPGGVIDLSAGAGGALLAVAVDAVASAADCAVLDLLAIREGPALPALFEALLENVEPFVRAGPRAGLEVPVIPRWAALAPILRRRGYGHAFTGYDMETPEQPPPPPAPLPGEGWRWVAADEGRRRAYYEVVRAAMADVPGAYVGAFESFRVGPPGEVDDLLLCGERVAGYACGVSREGGLGYVNILGRHPDFRGRGLGPALLTRAMRGLGAGGARRYGLDVSASNQAALTLYERYGFAITRAVPVYRRLRG